MEIWRESWHKMWATSGQTQNSLGPHFLELQSQPRSSCCCCCYRGDYAVVTGQETWVVPSTQAFYGPGSNHIPSCGVRQWGERKIELINTPWLPQTLPWGKSIIYKLTVLTQGKGFPQYCSVWHCLGFFLPCYSVATWEAMWHLMGGRKILKPESKGPP
jgi:hypothetical protein